MYGYNTRPMAGAGMMAPPPRYIVSQAPQVVVQQAPMVAAPMVAAPMAGGMAMMAGRPAVVQQQTTVVQRAPAHGMARGQFRTDPGALGAHSSDPRAPVMQGYLTKEGGIWKTWRKRWKGVRSSSDRARGALLEINS